MKQNNLISTPSETICILKYGSSILREKVDEVTDFKALPDIIRQMHKTMTAEHGIGLAANQIGICLNLMLIETSNYEDEADANSYVFINSEIIHSEGEIIMEEGCLSIPNIRAEIKRPETIILKYQDSGQNYHEKKYSGLTSRAIQHEMDHLNGKLFIDYLSQAKRMILNKRLLEISKTGQPSTGIIL